MGRKSVSKRQKNCIKGAAQQIVKDASSVVDPMERIAAFRTFERNGLCLSITYARGIDLKPETRDWALELTRNNMRTLYEKSEWGWSDQEKKSELDHPSARYVLATDTCMGEPRAFIHFRFDMDFGCPVLYCYELQVDKKVQRKGLGKFMMQILELMAFQLKLEKVVLTVFKHNDEALAFYRRGLNYRTDSSSPSVSGCEECYEILSKTLNRK